MLRKRVKEIENERNGMVKMSQEATKGDVTQTDVKTGQARI